MLIFFVCDISVSFDSFASKCVDSTLVRLTSNPFRLPLLPSKIVNRRMHLARVLFIAFTGQFSWLSFTLPTNCGTIGVHTCKTIHASAGTLFCRCDCGIRPETQHLTFQWALLRNMHTPLIKPIKPLLSEHHFVCAGL